MSSKIALMLGASNHTKEDRQEHDFYATDPIAIKKFLSRIANSDFVLNKNVWECACGDGALAKVLSQRGYNVRATDLIDRGYGRVQNFLTYRGTYNGDIITNPPFNKAELFISKSMNILGIGNKLIMFLRLQFLEGSKRNKLFKKYPLKYVYVHSSRIGILKNGDPKYNDCANTVCYAWFVWEKGFSGETTLRWIR